MTKLVRDPRVCGGGPFEGRTRDVKSPWDDSVVGTVRSATRGDVDAALRAAERGAAAMAAMPSHARAAILEGSARLVELRREDLARTIAREAGKPILDARVEVDRCVVTLRTGAEEAKRIGGEVLPLDSVANGTGRLGLLRRFPVGIVSAITPFNFPLNLAAHKVAPALASGNAVLLKPAPRTPLSAFALADVLLESGCPEEAIAVLPGDPPEIDALVEDPRVGAVSFTGSARVGWDIKRRAPSKRVTLELGGNAAAIVHADADLEAAVARCVAGAFAYSGQVCIRAQRLLLHESIADPFLDAFLAQARALRRGDPLDETTRLGPMIDAASARRAREWVEEALARGAKELLGGPPEVAMLPPTVLRDVQPGCRARDEEIFAPVVAVETYRDLDDALDRAGSTRYGLQAGLFTNDLRGVLRAWERLRVGALVHNDVPAFRTDPMPYGGVKESGHGREGLRWAIEEMTELRLLVLRPDPRR